MQHLWNCLVGLTTLSKLFAAFKNSQAITAISWGYLSNGDNTDQTEFPNLKVHKCKLHEHLCTAFLFIVYLMLYSFYKG